MTNEYVSKFDALHAAELVVGFIVRSPSGQGAEIMVDPTSSASIGWASRLADEIREACDGTIEVCPVVRTNAN